MHNKIAFLKKTASSDKEMDAVMTAARLKYGTVDEATKKQIVDNAMSLADRGMNWKTGLVDFGGAGLGAGTGWLISKLCGGSVPTQVLSGLVGGGLGYGGARLARRAVGKKHMRELFEGTRGVDRLSPWVFPVIPAGSPFSK